MPSKYVGRWRANALWRIAAFVAFVLTGLWFIVFAIGLIGGVVFFIVDVILQLFTGERGWETAGQSGAESWALHIFMWPFRILQYIFIGMSAFPWHPWVEGVAQ